jgi:hypothetical protein
MTSPGISLGSLLIFFLRLPDAFVWLASTTSTAARASSTVAVASSSAASASSCFAWALIKLSKNEQDGQGGIVTLKSFALARFSAVVGPPSALICSTCFLGEAGLWASSSCFWFSALMSSLTQISSSSSSLPCLLFSTPISSLLLSSSTRSYSSSSSSELVTYLRFRFVVFTIISVSPSSCSSFLTGLCNTSPCRSGTGGTICFALRISVASEKA